MRAGIGKIGDVKIEERDRYREPGRDRERGGCAIGSYKLPQIQMRRLDISYLSCKFGMLQLERHLPS